MKLVLILSIIVCALALECAYTVDKDTTETHWLYTNGNAPTITENFKLTSPSEACTAAFDSPVNINDIIADGVATVYPLTLSGLDFTNSFDFVPTEAQFEAGKIMDCASFCKFDNYGNPHSGCDCLALYPFKLVKVVAGEHAGTTPLAFADEADTEFTIEFDGTTATLKQSTPIMGWLKHPVQEFCETVPTETDADGKLTYMPVVECFTTNAESWVPSGPVELTWINKMHYTLSLTIEATAGGCWQSHDDVTFTVTATNTGGYPVPVTDINLGSNVPCTLGNLAGDTNNDLKMDAGETWTWTCTWASDKTSATTDTYHVHLAAIPTDGNTFYFPEAEKLAEVTVTWDDCPCEINIEKSGCENYVQIAEGNVITYLFLVNIPSHSDNWECSFDNIVVVDSNTDCSPALVAGDVSDFGVLNDGENWHFSCAVAVPAYSGAPKLHNDVSVTGDDTRYDHQETDDDEYDYQHVEIIKDIWLYNGLNEEGMVTLIHQEESTSFSISYESSSFTSDLANCPSQGQTTIVQGTSNHYWVKETETNSFEICEVKPLPAGYDNDLAGEDLCALFDMSNLEESQTINNYRTYDLKLEVCLFDCVQLNDNEAHTFTFTVHNEGEEGVHYVLNTGGLCTPAASDPLLEKYDHDVRVCLKYFTFANFPDLVEGDCTIVEYTTSVTEYELYNAGYDNAWVRYGGDLDTANNDVVVRVTVCNNAPCTAL